MKTVSFHLGQFWAFLVSLFLAPSVFTKRDPRAAGSDVPDHYVTKFADDITVGMQQTKSRLEGTVTVHDGIVGASESVDGVTATEAQQVTGRFSDIQFNDTPHFRRWIDLSDFDWADYIDTFDKLKVLADPTNKYVTSAIAAHNRQKDRVIINAIFGSARDQVGGPVTPTTSYVALPSGQIVAAAATNITMAKIRTGLEILNAAEAATAEEGGERFFLYTASQLTVLMADTSLTSSDYNTLRALQNYQVDQFMGMRWVRTELLPKAANIRKCAIYGKGYVHLGIGANAKTNVSQREDKRGQPYQVYAYGSYGAVRSEDKGVVEIDCQEP